MKTFTVSQNTSLKEFTDGTYPQGSFVLSLLLRKKDVKVNGVRVSKNVPLHAGDEVVYYTTPAQEDKPTHTVVYEDENVLVADKLDGVSFEGLLSELNGSGQYFGVHRLDRNTRGLIVFAKNRTAEAELLSAFKDRRADKYYIALCANNFKKKSGFLSAYLKKIASENRVEVYSAPVNGGSEIVTEYKVLEERGQIALVGVTLHTGRTHQIRAHMAHIGCPVLGDEKYGDGALNSAYGVRRQCLVSKRITFGLNGKLKYLSGKTFESAFTL